MELSASSCEVRGLKMAPYQEKKKVTSRAEKKFPRHGEAFQRVGVIDRAGRIKTEKSADIVKATIPSNVGTIFAYSLHR